MIYIFFSFILIAALGVIFSRNVVQSVLYLILVFFLCSLLFIYLGADFIGLIILIVYIGAIAVLFLFVVMMLNIRVLELASTFSIYFSLASFLSLIFVGLIIFIYWKSLNIIEFNSLISYTDWSTFNNIKIVAIGELLFNEGYILFLGATLLLFVAMIGVIILTLNKKIKVDNIYRISSKYINWKYYNSNLKKEVINKQ
jgi:NADH-quinone oxidoreductase subunit J